MCFDSTGETAANLLSQWERHMTAHAVRVCARVCWVWNGVWQ